MAEFSAPTRRAGFLRILRRLPARAPVQSFCSRFVVVAIDVDWTHGAAHMQANHKVTVTEANEAVADIDAVWFDTDPHSKSGRSVRVIGYSHSR